MLPPESARGPALREAIVARLEGIADPCSVAANAPAGLVSMGLVREIEIDEGDDGAHVRLKLCITEPGCMMAALFQTTAERELSALPEVSEVKVDVDYGYVWGPEDMAPDYRRRLADLRARTAREMRGLQGSNAGR